MLVRFLRASLVLVLFACSDDSSESYDGPTRALTKSVQSGIATFYDADGSGNCGFDKSPKDLDVAALSFPEYNKSASCGACLKVEGPKGEVVVRVVDSCPPCAENGVNIDLSESAFAKIADKKDGRIKIKYNLVSCETAGNLSYHFKDGSSKYWTAIQVRNHKVPILKLEYKKGSNFIAMKRESYNYFLDAKGVGDQSDGLQLRVTSFDDQTIEDVLSGGIPSNKTLLGEHQFE